MPLDITLSETQSLSQLVRGAQLVLALDATKGQQRVRLQLAGAGGVWRHLMGSACQTRLRALEREPPMGAAAHKLWLGPAGAAPQTLACGTWCIGTDALGEMRRFLTGHSTLPMWLVHPYAARAAQLGGTRHTTIPMASGAMVPSRTSQSPSGICVIGSGDAETDRATVALVTGRTAGDVVFFDPYQHHLWRGLAGVTRIVAPCGPARRSMLYASCRYVVSAAAPMCVDDHFVCEAVAMGLVPLAAFAPSGTAPSALWDSHAMAEAFSAAVAHSVHAPRQSTATMASAAQAVSVWQHLRRTAQGRPWGTGGTLGVVQSMTPGDVAAVRDIDGRALVVVCGLEASLGAPVRAWLMRCAYRGVCITGPYAAHCAPLLTQALHDAAEADGRAVPAVIAEIAGDAALATWLSHQRLRSPGLQFDIVHLGATAVDVLSMRGLIAQLEHDASRPTANGHASTEHALTLVVCARDQLEPWWLTPWRSRWPHTFVMQHEAPGLKAQDVSDPADAAVRAQVQALVSLPAAARIIDAGGGGAWLRAACRNSARAAPYVWDAGQDAVALGASIDVATLTKLHRGTCRGALGLAHDACVILVAAPHLDEKKRQALMPLWPCLRAACMGTSALVCVLAVPQAHPEAYLALEQDLERHALGGQVVRMHAHDDPFVIAPEYAPLHARLALWGAADIYLDGPWALSADASARAAAHAAALPVVAWPEVSHAVAPVYAQLPAFCVDAGSEQTMQASLLAYLQTLCIDAPLRQRLGLRGRQAFVQLLQEKADLDVLASRFAPMTAAPHGPQPPSAFASLAARMRASAGLVS